MKSIHSKFINLTQKNKLKIIGIMNGTSLDGIDYVLCEISRSKKSTTINKTTNNKQTNEQIKLVSFVEKKIPASLKKEFKKLTQGKAKSPEELLTINHKLSMLYAKQLSEIVSKNKWKFDAIGLHGQTIFHEGTKKTWQLCEPQFLTQKLNCPVIFDFRTADVLQKGQGAPLAPFFHSALLKNYMLKNSAYKSCAFLNIGGMSNITILDSSKKSITAFDIGPGNILMDSFLQNNTTQQFDKNGTLASKGAANSEILIKMLKHKFFKKAPPKSCGREEFDDKLLNKYKKLNKIPLEDAICTLAELTILSIFYAIKNQSSHKNSNKNQAENSINKIFVSGGGAKNKYIIKRLKQLLGAQCIQTSDEINWPTQSIEGAAFAYLASQNIWGNTLDLPSITGGKNKLVLGKISI